MYRPLSTLSKTTFLICLTTILSTARNAQAKFPKPAGHLSDFAGVIAKPAADSMESVLVELEEKTSAEVAVVTIQSLDGSDIETYANELFADWGIGKKGKDNGVLLLCAMTERQIRIETGYGLEGILPDAFCGRIIRDVMVPEFKKGDFTNGIYKAAIIIAGRIAGDAGIKLSGAPEISMPERGKAGLPYMLLLLVLAGPLMALSAGRRRLTGRSLFYTGFGGFGGGGFGSGGGFGGFGGGMSGGGGASGSW